MSTIRYSHLFGRLNSALGYGRRRRKLPVSATRSPVCAAPGLQLISSLWLSSSIAWRRLVVRFPGCGEVEVRGCDQLVSHSGMVIGTPVALPPEQAAGQTRVAPAADVYGLGVVLLYLLYASAGHYPYSGASPVLVIADFPSTRPGGPVPVRDLRGGGDVGT
jgi:serine/threonine protein kinase